MTMRCGQELFEYWIVDIQPIAASKGFCKLADMFCYYQGREYHVLHIRQEGGYKECQIK
jgi:hypothetical protein